MGADTCCYEFISCLPPEPAIGFGQVAKGLPDEQLRPAFTATLSDTYGDNVEALAKDGGARTGFKSLYKVWGPSDHCSPQGKAN
jgi:hypothetical protein